MAYGQYFSLVEETTWGSSPARTAFAKLLAGSGLHHRANREKSAKLSSNVGADREGNFDKGQHAEGKIMIPLSYDDKVMLKVLKHLLGTAATTGAGPFTHTFTRSVALAGGSVPTAVGLSAELNYELPDASLQARLLAGGRVRSCTISINAGDTEPALDCDLIGKEQTQVVKTGSPVFPDYETYGMNFAQVSALTIGGVTGFAPICSGFDLTIDNGYEPRHRLGSINTQRPLRRGVATISGVLRLDWETSPSVKALWDAFKANTVKSIALTLTSGAHSFALTLGTCHFNDSDLQPEEGEIQPAEFPFSVSHNATTTAVQAVVVSPTATV